jgi:hypothetical protein
MSRKMSKGFKCDLCSVVLTSKFNLERHRGSKRCVSKAKLCGIGLSGNEEPPTSIIKDELSPADKTVAGNDHYVLKMMPPCHPTQNCFRRVMTPVETPYRLRMSYQDIPVSVGVPSIVRFTCAEADMIINLRVRDDSKNVYGAVTMTVRLGTCTLLEGFSIGQLVEMTGQRDNIVNLSELLFGAPVGTLNGFNVLNHSLELEFKTVYPGEVGIWADLVTLSEDMRHRFNYQHEVYINQFSSCCKPMINTILPVSAIYHVGRGKVCLNEDTDIDLVPRPSSSYYYYSVTPSDQPSTSLVPSTLINALPTGKYEFMIDDMCSVPQYMVFPYILQYVTLLRIDKSQICCYHGLTEEELPPKEKLYRLCCQLYGTGDIANLNLELGNSPDLAAGQLCVNSPSVVIEPNWYGGYGSVNINNNLSFPAIMNLESWLPDSKRDLEVKLTMLYQKSKTVPMLHTLDSVYVYGKKMIDEINMEKAMSRCPPGLKIEEYYEFDVKGVNGVTKVIFPGWMWITCFEMGAYPSALFIHLADIFLNLTDT